MSDALRIGVLGTGGIVENAMIIPAKQVPEVTVTAIGSRALERAQSYAKTHGVPRALSYESLVEDPNIDIVYIALPPSMHAEWSIRALERGKHVLCEKPMASNVMEARKVALVARQSGRVFMEAFHYPYHPLAKRVRDLMDTGAIGAVQSAEVTFNIPGRFIPPGSIRRIATLGGGAMMDAGCYALRILRDLLGTMSSVISAEAILEQDDPQVDMRMDATIEFCGGREGRLAVSFLAGDTPEIVARAIGSRGRLETTSLIVPQWGGSVKVEWPGGVYSEKADPTPSYLFQLRELVRCIRDGAPVLTSAEAGVSIMRAIDEVYVAAGLRVRGAL